MISLEIHHANYSLIITPKILQLRKMMNTIFILILSLFVVIIFIGFAIQIIYKKDKPFWSPYMKSIHRVLNWFPVLTIPLFIGAIFEGDQINKLIPVFMIILYEFLHRCKLLNKSEVVTSLMLYVFINFLLWGFVTAYIGSAGGGGAGR